MRERGVSNHDAAYAIAHPLKAFDVDTDELMRRLQKLIGRSATVVINPDTGDVITAYKTKARIARKYETETDDAKQ